MGDGGENLENALPLPTALILIDRSPLHKPTGSWHLGDALRVRNMTKKAFIFLVHVRDATESI